MTRQALAMACGLWVCGGSGCSRAPRRLPLGADLRGLPRAGSQPLLAIIPDRAEAAAVVRDPRALWQALAATPAARWAAAHGMWEEAAAFPPIERWRALQERLSELAREPVPGLGALLDAPAAIGWVAEDRGHPEAPSGLIYVARLDERWPTLWSLARALNAVRPSGRDVEVSEVRGLPIREVAAGRDDRLSYALLADRLIVATDSGLVAEAVALALGAASPALSSKAPFSDLEARATLVGLAAAWTPGALPVRALGIRQAEVDGPQVALALDPALWASGGLQPVADPAAFVRVGLLGLSAPAALRALQTAAPAPPRLTESIEGVAAELGRGVFLEISPWADGVAVALDLLRAQATGGSLRDPMVLGLAERLLSAPGPAEPLGGGWARCDAGDEVCLLSCPGLVRLAWPGAFAKARGCPSVREGPAAQAVLSIGSADVALAVALRDGRGELMWGAP